MLNNCCASPYGSEWRKVTIDGVSLPEALKCWENGRHEKNRYEILTQAERGQSYLSSAEPKFITRYLHVRAVKHPELFFMIMLVLKR